MATTTMRPSDRAAVEWEQYQDRRRELKRLVDKAWDPPGGRSFDKRRREYADIAKVAVEALDSLARWKASSVAELAQAQMPSEDE